MAEECNSATISGTLTLLCIRVCRLHTAAAYMQSRSIASRPILFCQIVVPSDLGVEVPITLLVDLSYDTLLLLFCAIFCFLS